MRVRVAVGIDMALVVALLICYDAVMREQKEAKVAVYGAMGESVGAAAVAASSS